MSGVNSKPIGDDELKANRLRLLNEKANVTGKISDTCRFVGFGLLAVFYTIKLDLKSLTPTFDSLPSGLVIAVGLFGGLAIFFDYLQYWCGSRAVDHALSRSSRYDYDENRWEYKGRKAFYCLKQLAVFLGVLSIIIVVLLV